MTSSIGGVAGGFSPASFAEMREQRFKALDADGSGGVDETEFANGPSGSGGMDSGIASALFKAFDTDSDGSLTQDELETGFQKLSSSMRSVLIGTQEADGSSDTGEAGGPGGPDGPPPPPSDASGSSDGTDSSSLDTLLSLLQSLNGDSSSDDSSSDEADSATGAVSAVRNDFKQLLSDLQKLVQSGSATSSTAVSA